MSERDERVRSLADDIWDDFKGSKFVDITPRDAESIARTVLDSPAMRDLLAEAWQKGLEAGTDMGLGIGERVAELRAEWPPVPANPYRAEGDR